MTASIDFNATTTAQDVVVAAGLTVGTRYRLQNVDNIGGLFFRVAATRPEAGARGFHTRPGGDLYFQADEGDKLWLWTNDMTGCSCIIGESF